MVTREASRMEFRHSQGAIRLACTFETARAMIRSA